MEKPAPVDHPIHDLMRRRWSPRAFEPRSLAADDLLSILEAARWSASASNEQPWRFIVALREPKPEFDRLLACLVEGNRRWAMHAGALLLTVARLDNERNGKPNRHAWHDTGMALAHMLLEATARGIAAHPMAGFDPALAREIYGIPAGFEPVTAVAFGRPAPPESLPEDLRVREVAPRIRRPLSDSVFTGAWGSPAPFTRPGRAA
jgi:nitroreductase